MSSKKVIVPKS